MLLFHWRERDLKDFQDLVPAEWFEKEGDVADQVHAVLAPNGNLHGQATCRVLVKATTAELDYGGEYKQANKKADMLVGSLLIHFTDPTRRDIDFVEWRHDGDEAFALCNITVVDLDDLSSREGYEAKGSRRYRVRSRKLREAKIRSALVSKTGLVCEVCDLNPRELYGDVGVSACEVHHRDPISTGERQTTLEDLAIVCATCHNVIHGHHHLTSIAEVRRTLRR